MFKKRNTEKKKVDVQEDIETIQVEEKTEKDPITVAKSIHSKKINKFSNKHEK